MRTALIGPLLALALTTAETPSSAADAPTPREPWLRGPFSFYVENDSLPLAGGDESYTQGLELHLTLGKGRLPFPLNALRRATLGPLSHLEGDREFDEQSSFFFGQTIFTPQNIVTYTPRQDDRPFVGYLYGGVSSVLTAGWAEEGGKTLRPRRITGQISAGVTGDLALAHTAQAAFHVLRESRIPKGWYTQAGNRPEVNALLMWEEILPLGSRHDLIDLTLVGKAALGTTQTFASGGAVIRVGWGLSGFPPLNVPFSAEKSSLKDLEIAAFAGAEAKALARTRFADQGGEGRPTFVPVVYEWRVGAMARWKSGLSLSYAVRRRSQEIEPLPPGLRARHFIGALQIAKAEGRDGKCECYAFLKGLRVNFRLGRGVSSTITDMPAAPRVSLAGHWGAEKSLFSDRYSFAVETTGVVREHGRGTGTGHEDTFLLAKVATLGRDLLPHLGGRHRLQLRVGGGMSTVKMQAMSSEGGIDEPEPLTAASETGGSGLAGLRYACRVGKPVSVAMDVAYSRLFLDGAETGLRSASYWTWTAGLQLHPWGRDRKRPQP